MMMLDKDIDRAHALVIDGNPSSRSIITAQLRDLGVPNIVQAPRLSDGRRRLETQRFDIVVCEQVFPGEDMTGQELLEDLRRANLLPYDTVFVMVTGEARYEHVAEAAESALDSYLLKPYAASTLCERLRHARHRKRSLSQIFAAMEAGELELAAALCLKRYREQGEYWLYAARLGAELLLRLSRHDIAAKLYEAIIESRAVPWARLGVARTQVDAGQLNQARKSLETLLSSEPDYADAWDVMGRVQVEQGRFDEALETYRKAASLTPGSIPRLQKQGLLAYYNGDLQEAEKLLDRAVLLGVNSKMFDMQSLVVLGLARFGLKDAKGLQRCKENLEHFAKRGGENERLERFVILVTSLERMAAGQKTRAVELAETLTAQRSDATLDIEAACNLLALLAELTQAGACIEDVGTCVLELARRFSTSRSVGELLTRAVARHPPFLELVEQGHADVLSLSEKAMNHVLEGHASRALEGLMEAARSTLNAKLVDTAAATLQRYRQKIENPETWDASIEDMRRQYALSWAAPRLGQGERAAGALVLRTGNASGNTNPAAGQAVRTDSPAPAVSPAA
ncbi:response regulator [Rubrivivax albus]|uniref:Response regulator n=1 Tax=Rubrivivax albus TaxID=2499835 RepID=A0A437K1M9_9BURK|nr:tetratricopeptide repeat protein [Rubrivivax albus]RVT54213.1 response regulator [Rubrivivax albus]